MASNKHDVISMKLCEIFDRFDNFITARDPRSQQNFKGVFLAKNARGALVKYHNLITTNDASSRFLDDLVDAYEYEEFSEWCDVLLTNSLRAYWCAIFQRRLESECGEIGAPTLHVQEEELESLLGNIVKTVKSAQNRYHRKPFIVRQPENQANGEKPTSDFIRLVDGFMVSCNDAPSRANQQLAGEIGKQLTDRYPWLTWAVVIAEDNHDWRNFIFYSTDFKEHLLFQTSDHEQTLPLLNEILSSGPLHTTKSSGQRYGLFTCKRKFRVAGKLVHQRRITIFWIRHDDIMDVNLMADDDSGLRKLDIKKLAKDFNVNKIKERSKHRTEQHRFIEDALYRNGYQYVAYLGLRKSRDACITGMYLSNHDVSPSWPYHVQNDSGHLVLWITNVTQCAINRMREVSELRLAEEFLRRGAGCRLPQIKTIAVRKQPLPNTDAEGLLKAAEESIDSGNKYLSTGFVDKAITKYEYAKSLLDRPSTKSGDGRISLLKTVGCNLALSYLQRRDVQAAEESANAVLRHEADNPHALIIRSLVHVALRDYHKSQRDIITLLMKQPAHPMEIVLKVIQLGTIDNNYYQSSQQSRLTADWEICSKLPLIMRKLSLKVYEATEAEPYRKDAIELRNTLSAVNTFVHDAVEKLQSEQSEANLRILLGWLDAVFQVASHIFQLRKEWVFIRRENVEMALLMLKVLIAGKSTFLKDVFS
ncbi:uncharacterized protein LOC129598462 [Paramacrobiotus metropolitanus]|uniref:uncharacterized protein LOC129598462 n=1 Tax=Paramacrobiotus metropolitanus TaxID=2943436 RepID=UPI002446323B|nr:uncharacterized protein LOC129598462 [Paramacrobiotus metropolitanus]